MNPNHHQPTPDLPLPQLTSLRIQPPTVSPTIQTPTSTAQRRIAIAVDLSDESAYAVKWAVNNYLRSGDTVILLHVRPTSILYGADWGSMKFHINDNNNDQDGRNSPVDDKKLEDDFDNFTTTKANDLAQPLVDAGIPFKIHIVKDHDMKERLCLEVERLGLSAVIMGSRGFGANRRRRSVNNNSGKRRLLGSVSDYCVHHCICPVVVVRYPEDDNEDDKSVEGSFRKEDIDVDLHPVPEEDDDGEQEYHDASSDEHKEDA